MKRPCFAVLFVFSGKGQNVMKKPTTRDLILAALFVALGLLLPVMFHAIGAGPVMLPMHIPVLLCGFICG